MFSKLSMKAGILIITHHTEGYYFILSQGFEHNSIFPLGPKLRKTSHNKISHILKSLWWWDQEHIEVAIFKISWNQTMLLIQFIYYVFPSHNYLYIVVFVISGGVRHSCLFTGKHACNPVLTCGHVRLSFNSKLPRTLHRKRTRCHDSDAGNKYILIRVITDCQQCTRVTQSLYSGSVIM